MNKQEFIRYFDHSADSETIYFELNDSYEFEECFAIMEEADTQDLRDLQNRGWNISNVETGRQTLFDLIREVWDKAYSYGYHNGQTEAGLTLEEIEN